uniref:C2 domain-containing protein n=1 Tax=Spongospora subterranea TaxID=70186 RepID=A0A0H5RB90_9EUKA|eukprot:CRZ11475.1 hypothetical protein [Spongospora subterranea]
MLDGVTYKCLSVVCVTPYACPCMAPSFDDCTRPESVKLVLVHITMSRLLSAISFWLMLIFAHSLSETRLHNSVKFLNLFISCTDLPERHGGIVTPDIYVEVESDQFDVNFRTEHIQYTNNPSWRRPFRMSYPINTDSFLKFTLHYNDKYQTRISAGYTTVARLFHDLAPEPLFITEGVVDPVKFQIAADFSNICTRLAFDVVFYVPENFSLDICSIESDGGPPVICENVLPPVKREIIDVSSLIPVNVPLKQFCGYASLKECKVIIKPTGTSETETKNSKSDYSSFDFYQTTLQLPVFDLTKVPELEGEHQEFIVSVVDDTVDKKWLKFLTQEYSVDFAISVGLTSDEFDSKILKSVGKIAEEWIPSSWSFRRAFKTVPRFDVLTSFYQSYGVQKGFVGKAKQVTSAKDVVKFAGKHPVGPFDHLYFAPSIRWAISRSRPTGDRYTILMIVADGECKDVDDTISLLVDVVSNHPISVVLIEVGEERTKSLPLIVDTVYELVSFDERAPKFSARRNSVHFIHVERPFKNQNEMFASVLKEVPRQFSEFVARKTCLSNLPTQLMKFETNPPLTLR